MSLSFEEQIQQANVLLQENELEKSIENYLEALQLATKPEQKIHLQSVLGRLYQKTKQPKKAIEAFENALQHNSSGKDAETASILNNIAAIYAATDLPKAIDCYKEALAIYQELAVGDSEFNPHLANTQFALAEVYAKKKDYYFAKKYYKASIKLYEGLKGHSFLRLRSSAHYQLGNIYTEEFNLFDAKVHYLKAKTLFEDLIGEGEDNLKPYLAAVINNLAVTFNSMEEPEKALDHYRMALDVYKELAHLNFDIFQPYVAATYNSLGIVHSEMKNFEKAIEYIDRSVELYNELADIRPQEYTHYLATGLHNLGLFHFELRHYDLAKDYFNQALELRRRLAAEQPGEFDADYCATALNLVELYQSQLEQTINFDYKDRALDLLGDVEIRLAKYTNDLPVIKNMKNDCKYYLDFFTDIEQKHLTIQHVLRRVNYLKEEIDGTIDPKEKIKFQEEIMDLLTDNFKKYPENDRLKYELALSHANLSWLQLRLQDFKAAEQTIVNAPILESPLLSLSCNLAHCYLLQGKKEKALEIYGELADKVSVDNEKYRDIIVKDFETLKRDGVDNPNFEVVAKHIQ